MPSSHATAPSAFPDDVNSWWTTSYPIPETTIDEYGHVTAVHFPVAFEQAAVQFLRDVWAGSGPDFVVAETHLVYRNEVLMENSPARISVAAWLVGNTSFGLHSVLADSTGTQCAYSSMRYVVWDRMARTKCPIPQEAREALEHRRG